MNRVAVGMNLFASRMNLVDSEINLVASGMNLVASGVMRDAQFSKRTQFDNRVESCCFWGSM